MSNEIWKAINGFRAGGIAYATDIHWNGFVPKDYQSNGKNRYELGAEVTTLESGKTAWFTHPNKGPVKVQDLSHTSSTIVGPLYNSNTPFFMLTDRNKSGTLFFTGIVFQRK